MKKNRVVAVFTGEKRDLGACEIYRVTMPLSYLAQSNAWDAGWFFVQDLINTYGDNGLNEWARIVNHYDLFIFPRHITLDQESYEQMRTFMSVLKNAGKRVIYEVDDDYTNEHRQVHNGDAIGVAALADAITVTTPMLADLMKRKTGRPAYALPNMLDFKLWGYPISRTVLGDKIRIGLTGSPTHEHDWRVLETVLPKIIEKYPNVQLGLGGYHPEYLKEIPRTQTVPPLAYASYAQLIKTCDIILAPVDPHDKFNDSKSPIKATEGQGAARHLEGKLAGAAVIATNNRVYQSVIQNRQTGMLVDHTPVAWQAALELLIEDHALRHAIQYSAYRWCSKHYDIAKHWTKWSKAYREILEKHHLPLALPAV